MDTRAALARDIADPAAGLTTTLTELEVGSVKDGPHLAPGAFAVAAPCAGGVALGLVALRVAPDAPVDRLLEAARALRAAQERLRRSIGDLNNLPDADHYAGVQSADWLTHSQAVMHARRAVAVAKDALCLAAGDLSDETSDREAVVAGMTRPEARALAAMLIVAAGTGDVDLGLEVGVVLPDAGVAADVQDGDFPEVTP